MVFAATDPPLTVLWAELHGCTKGKLVPLFLKKDALVDECVKASIFRLQEKILIQLEKTVNVSRIINWAKN